MIIEQEQKKNTSPNTIAKITKRSDYLRASKSKFLVSESFILQFHNRKDTKEPRYGITVTKKIGNASKRNKVKRRIRHLIKDFLPKYGKNGYDYVFIAKENLISENWDKLKLESISVLKELKYE